MSHRTSVIVLSLMVVVRLAAMLAMLKLLGSIFGPDGFGGLSQIMGIGALFYMLAGGGVTNGLVKHVAAAQSLPDQARWLSAGGAIAAASALGLALIAVALFLFGAEAVLGDARLAWVFLVIAAAQVFVGAGNVALAYLSGTGDLKRFAAAHAAGNLLMLALVAGLALSMGFVGAAIGSALLPLGPALLGLLFLIVRLGAELPASWRPERARIAELLKFSGVMLVAVTAVPLAQLYIRADLGSSLGWEEVGQWQAVARISDAYMQVFGVLFMNLYLPQLSRAEPGARPGVMKMHGASVLGLFLIGAAFFWALRDPVIRIAFSPEFLPAARFVDAQLAGDLFKIGAFLGIYYFIAAGKVWVQGMAELLQGVSVVLFFVLLKPNFAADAAVYAHALACFAVLVTVGLLFCRRSLSGERST